MIACFYNKEDIGDTINLEGITKIELTERDKGNDELVYYIELEYAPDTRIMLSYDRWRLLWADTRKL